MPVALLRRSRSRATSRSTRAASLPSRDGVALVMAVVAMAVLGVLVTGVFFAAMREQRDGRDAVSRVQALAAAEYGLELTLTPEKWRSGWNTTARRGLLDTLPYDVGAGSSDTVHLWKLESNAFLVDSRGAAGPAISQARRRVALLVTLRVPRLARRGAVTVRDGATIADSSAISGLDSAPTGWSCPPDNDALPAIALPAVSLVDEAACTVHPCLTGSPPVSVDSASAEVATYEQFGDVSRASIAAAAVQLPNDAVIVAPAPSLDGAGECDRADERNLGDPGRAPGMNSACADYFPVVHAPGSMRLRGGTGQGVLLVDGDLTIDSGARFFGVVAVLGVLRVTEGAEIRGQLLASRILVNRGSRVGYSSCAAKLALRAAGVPVVPPGQAWSELP